MNFDWISSFVPLTFFTGVFAAGAYIALGFFGLVGMLLLLGLGFIWESVRG